MLEDVFPEKGEIKHFLYFFLKAGDAYYVASVWFV